MKLLSLTATVSLLASQATADVTVRFLEGAPKDRFVVSNPSCETGPLTVTIDLRPSAGALIFDVTGKGAGVEVFQPFELVSGGSLVAEAPLVKDGDQVLTLGLTTLGPETDVSFTIDLDDTVDTRAIAVAGSELSGAKVILTSREQSVEGTFDASARMTIPWTDCTS